MGPNFQQRKYDSARLPSPSSVIPIYLDESSPSVRATLSVQTLGPTAQCRQTSFTSRASATKSSQMSEALAATNLGPFSVEKAGGALRLWRSSALGARDSPFTSSHTSSHASSSWPEALAKLPAQDQASSRVAWAGPHVPGERALQAGGHVSRRELMYRARRRSQWQPSPCRECEGPRRTQRGWSRLFFERCHYCDRGHTSASSFSR